MGRIELKTLEQVRYMRRAGLVVSRIHSALRQATHSGVRVKDLDRVSAQAIADAGAQSNFLGYMEYPATVCISVNDRVVHGIPDDHILESGDLVSFDCGAYVNEAGKQWHGDAAFSMIVDGDAHASVRRQRLNAITEEAMWTAIAALATARRVGEVGDAVEDVVAAAHQQWGWEPGIVEEFTGHGIGTAMHQPPDVLNYSASGRSSKIKVGMVLAIEPILTSGDAQTKTLADGWTVITADGSDAAHWEHTVAILDNGISVLTAHDSGAEGLAKFGIVPVTLP